MRRMCLAIAAIVLAAPGAAAGAGSVGPSVIFNGDGISGPPGTPAGAMRYSTIVDNRGTTVLATETDGGEVRRQRSLADNWAPLAVTIDGKRLAASPPTGKPWFWDRRPVGYSPKRPRFSCSTPSDCGSANRSTSPAS